MKRIIFAVLSLALLFLCSCTPPAEKPQPGETRTVTVLMYHYVQQEIRDDFDITPERFRQQMEAIKAAGYETVSLSQLCAFAAGEAQLPEKPVLVTFDDGYISVYSQAFPILRELEQKAVSFTIGWSVGLDVYKNTGNAMSDHYDWTEAEEMLSSGVFEIQSHTYDMHQWPPYEEQQPAREYAAPLEGESDESFAAALGADWQSFSELLSEKLNTELFAFAYPGGVASAKTDALLRSFGARVTITTAHGTNTVTAGSEDSLYLMNRCNISNNMTGQQLVSMLDSFMTAG